MTSVYVGASGQIPKVHVYDVTNNVVLFENDADAISNYPASCVKLMTLLLLREAKGSSWTETVTITDADISAPFGLGGLSKIGLYSGDVLTWEDLAYGMMLVSGFDGAQAIARVLGNEAYAAAGNTGSTGMARFVEMMNARASDLGMTNTTFTDPSGVSQMGDTVENRMSARDLGRVAREVWVGDVVAIGVCHAATHDLVITGPHARTQTVANVVPFLNDLATNPLGASDPLIGAAKSGIWLWNDNHMYNMVTLFDTPNADIIITTIGSYTADKYLLDQRALMLAVADTNPSFFE